MTIYFCNHCGGKFEQDSIECPECDELMTFLLPIDNNEELK